MMLGAAVPASAQPARAATTHVGVTQFPAAVPCTPNPIVSVNAKRNADGKYRVEAIIQSNPCGFPVEAAATCYSTPTASKNIYGTDVYEDGAESFAVCDQGTFYYFVHGGYRYEPEFDVWVYHTYILTCKFGKCGP